MKRAKFVGQSVLLGGLLAVLVLPAARLSSQQAARRPSTIEEQVAEARHQALEQFRNLRKPSRWQKMRKEPIGRAAFENTPTAEAVKEVARRLKLKASVAAGVEGTVTYSKEGTLDEFIQEGLDSRYWYLTLDDDTLHVKPFVQTLVGTVSPERGMYYSVHDDELKAAARRAGALKEYDERIHIDAAGNVTIRGRVWFIDKVKQSLKVED